MNPLHFRNITFRVVVPIVVSSLLAACGGGGSSGPSSSAASAAATSLPAVATVPATTPAVSATTTSLPPVATAPAANGNTNANSGSGNGATGSTSTTPGTTTATCYQANSTVTLAIPTEAAWDTQWAAKYGSTLPNLSGDGQTFAWQGFYDVRAYVSMAKTFGATKYLDSAVTTINYWFANTDGGPLAQGWAYSYGEAQMMLDTGIIAQAITTFAYEVWNDPRFVAYRPQATAYIAKLEPMLHTYDAQWVTNAPYAGAPSDWVYQTCGSGSSMCSAASLVMFNQSATLAKSLLLISRIETLEGLTPNPEYLVKANAIAAYFKSFVTSNGSAYWWSYGGARTSGNGPEDISHGDIDLSLVNWAEHYGLGGLTATDMNLLVGTEKTIFDEGSGSGLDAYYVDGTGTPTAYYSAAIGWSWLDVTDFDPSLTLFNKTVAVFNTYPLASNPDGYFLGWAEILRKKSCVSLY